MTPEFLDLPMGENDANAVTVRDYLKALLRKLFAEGEGFSGKRPFGNSGWEGEIAAAFVKAGRLKGKMDGVYAEGYSDDELYRLTQAAIAEL